MANLGLPNHVVNSELSSVPLPELQINKKIKKIHIISQKHRATYIAKFLLCVLFMVKKTQSGDLLGGKSHPPSSPHGPDSR